jgi:outer membrane protein, heavy metal efflux system
MALLLIVLIVLATGVAHAQTSAVWDSVPDSVAASSDTLTLTDVLSRIKRSNPTLRALPHRVAAATALVDQAGSWPNPELVALAENVDGSYAGFDQAELSLWFSQEFELGGKRSKRVDQASRVADEIARDTRTEAFEIYLEAIQRYTDVLHAEERVRLAGEGAAIVEALARSADERVRAGATLTADAALASVELARSKFVIDAARVERTRARVALAALWGDAMSFDEPVARSVSRAAVSLAVDSTTAWALRSPSVKQLQLARATRRANAALERSLRVPDLTIDAGLRRVEVDQASTLLLGVALPLPLWDRRAGAIRAAEAETRASDLEIERARANVTSALVARFGSIEVLQNRLTQTETTLVPAMATALENMRIAYAIGRVSYSDLLEVERSLIGLYNDANDTRRAIVEETIHLERLTGRTLEELMGRE